MELAVWVLLCSSVKTGVCCFTSSIPAIRHFFQHRRACGSDPNSKRHASTFITRGPSLRQTKGRDSTDVGFSLATVRHGRDKDAWEQINDGASDSNTAPINNERIYA
ncbi:uncharacterized protein M421DRAFT_302860 [Didymella exigua CBS 183.55]|uniref:Secreted protein n=1 Tax=Didymella exigua CBS 183.55 TaxID=1150837 RepID=A0A6A5R925_9PLEO|nr:uncharacterized protein M421DRAFT_302860 [Didymella exigua CBS 183.55]KAF1923829.1 hypothetical protein M421DRAFT_302860 [Didymella exigua CBS 183.55]